MSEILRLGQNAIVTLFLTLGSIILVLIAGLKHVPGRWNVLLAVAAAAALCVCGFPAFLSETGLIWSGGLLPLGLLMIRSEEATFGMALRLSVGLLAAGLGVGAVAGVLSLPPFGTSVAVDLAGHLVLGAVVALGIGYGTARWLQQELGSPLWSRILGLQLVLMSLPYLHNLLSLPYEPSLPAMSEARLDAVACALGFLSCGMAACVTRWHRTPATLQLPGGLTIIFDN
jgi:hypothetical protein